MKRISNHWTLLVLVVVLSMGFLTSMGVKNAVAQATTFAVDYQYNWPTTGPGFQVRVKVYDASFLYSWQVWMEYDPAVLSFTGIVSGGFLTTQPEGSDFTYSIPMAGTILFSEITKGSHQGKSAAEGLLATVTFNVLTQGHTTISISGGTYAMTYYMECFSVPNLVKKYPTTQNGYMCTLAGDTSSPPDGDVDYDDFIALAGAYGSSVGQAAYKANADFDHDGDIDYNDFIKLAGNYGRIV